MEPSKTKPGCECCDVCFNKRFLKFVCECGKRFTRSDSLKRHAKSCRPTRPWGSVDEHIWPRCRKRWATAIGRHNHLRWHSEIAGVSKPKRAVGTGQPAKQPRNYRCRRCGLMFDNRRELYIHGKRFHDDQPAGNENARGSARTRPRDDQPAGNENARACPEDDQPPCERGSAWDQSLAGNELLDLYRQWYILCLRSLNYL